MSKVIGFHYTLTNNDGAEIDSSVGQNPLLFMTETGHIIPGLEKELVAMNVGDKKVIKVGATEAYGERNDEMVITVKKDQFPEAGAELKLGMQFQVNEDPQAPLFQVMNIEGDDVTLDGNHPLAGMDLTFDVEITENRDSTEEEKAHGHAHGPGGHNH